MDVEFCPDVLPAWDLQCWGTPAHKGGHRGGNFETRRIGSWGPGRPTHVEWMKR